jgi:hypothetical protein
VAFIAFLKGQSGHRIFYFRQKPLNKIHGESVLYRLRSFIWYVINEIIGDDFFVDNKFDNNTLSEKILLYLQTKNNYFHG